MREFAAYNYPYKGYLQRYEISQCAKISVFIGQIMYEEEEDFFLLLNEKDLKDEPKPDYQRFSNSDLFFFFLLNHLHC